MPALAFVSPDQPDYGARLRALCGRASESDRAVEERARAIVEQVRSGGDAALRELTLSLEKRTLDRFELPRGALDAALGEISPAVRGALERAARRIRAFHERWHESGFVMDEPGIRLGLRVHSLDRVGLYVPGGTARYPSTVLMTAIPARVAGVREIVMTTPGPSPETLAAAALAGVDRIFLLGGAQAIAALAFGTESVPRVDKIVGPGNAYVAAAKRLVFGAVDIDAVAGPSEVLVLADDSARPEHVAADLLAQAEHDASSYAVLVTPSERLARAVVDAVDAQLATLPRQAIARAAIEAHGAVVLTRDLDGAIAFANDFAPEHLGLVIADPEAALPKLVHMGACFVGPHTPEAVGDYMAGPNHVLPTGGTARHRSPLGTWDFVRRSTLVRYEEPALRAQAEDILRLTEVEGLSAHGRAISMRIGEGKGGST